MAYAAHLKPFIQTQQKAGLQLARSLGDMMSVLAFDSLIKIEELPEEFRTGHWYNDLQHGMLVILLRRSLMALSKDRPYLAHRLIDTLTLYLYVHFLDEEAGMAASLNRGLHHAEAIHQHLLCHEWFLTTWDQKILCPLKNGAPLSDVCEAIVSYYNAILSHIQGSDQETYGHGSEFDLKQRTTEIASIANASLPLSPYMEGAYAVVQVASPETARLLDVQSLPPAALRPLETRATSTSVPHWQPMLPGHLCVHDAVQTRLLGRSSRLVYAA